MPAAWWWTSRLISVIICINFEVFKKKQTSSSIMWAELQPLLLIWLQSYIVVIRVKLFHAVASGFTTCFYVTNFHHMIAVWRYAIIVVLKNRLKWIPVLQPDDMKGPVLQRQIQKNLQYRKKKKKNLLNFSTVSGGEYKVFFSVNKMLCKCGLNGHWNVKVNLKNTKIKKSQM